MLMMLFSLMIDFFHVFTCFGIIHFLVSKLEAHADYYIAHDIYFTEIKRENSHKRLLYFFYLVYVIVTLLNLCKVI